MRMLLIILLSASRALYALGATHYVCPRQTAEEQSAAFVLVSKLPDTNCLDYRAARHECVQVGTTHFYNFLTVSTLFIKIIVLRRSILAYFATQTDVKGFFA